uniref:Telomerase reverse transcriptase n=1 Tax=Takifugu rubripes TaxID=31033 RepID=A0A674P7D3_TAKRU
SSQKMSITDLSPTLGILRSLYPHVQVLVDFADDIVFREGHKATLIEESDTSHFKSFVRGIFVCFHKELQQVPSCNQICTLPELLAFVLNSVKRKRKRNVLAHGYNFQSLAQEERDADQFKLQGDVTQSAAYVHGSDLWRKVSMRLGTDITRYLFESCSVFVAVPPSCLFQVCGIPIYDCFSLATASLGFSLQSRGCRERCLGVNSMKRRAFNVKRYLRKRKTETDQKDEARVCSGKRRRVMEEDKVSCETMQDGESGKTTLVQKQPGSKKRSEMEATLLPLEGGPSWRSGTFPPLPPSQSFMRTLGFLYGGRGMRSFLLNRKKKTAEGFRKIQGRDLIRIVFFEGVLYLNGLERKPKKLPRRFFNMVPLFSQLLRQHRRCPYSRLLQKTCPLVGIKDAGQAELSSFLPQHCGSHRVYLFVRECLLAVIPQELWGSEHNRLLYFARVRFFLRSGKFERLSVAELMWKIKVNNCDWLKISRVPPSELSYRTQILGQFLAWLLDGFVVGLVRACFYATESMGQKNAIRFYRQEVWAKLQDLAFRSHISKGQMVELTPDQVAALPKSTIISRLRFIPKTDGMRPITRVIGADLYQSHVRDLLDMLRACVCSTPSLLGSTVWGMTDIHKVLSSIAPAQKEKPQPLYFVKMDVSGAYESLPHNKLIEVINQVLTPVLNEVFTIRRFAKIWADSHEGLKKAFIRQADFLEANMGSINMKQFLTSLQKKGKLHHSVLVEQVRLVFVFFRTYRQCQGVPQGSAVSSVLCCLCYGHMENVLFKDIINKKSCLMRLVDDFLLITPNLHDAQTFLKILLAGVPQYGLVVNPQKVVVNFEDYGSTDSCPGLRVLPLRCLFPWCGLLLDTHTLDIYKDYSSYADLSLRYSLTLGSCHSAGHQMKRKLMGILRLKCHALFLDLKTNSLEAIYKNIYKLLLLHALRFHVCAQSLPFGQSVAKNPAYFLLMIWDMVEYTNYLIRLSNNGLISGSTSQTGSVQYEAVELLFCLSFLLVLSKHRRLYKDLLLHLHKRKRRLEQCLGDLRLARVRQAANPRNPLDFLAIKT